MSVRSWMIIGAVAVLAIGAGVGIGAAVWTGGDHGSDTGAMSADGGHGRAVEDHGGAMTGAGGSNAGAMNERDFLELMVPHHESAIAMARLATTRGQHPEVRRLARQIIASQEAEITRMRAWHREWFGEQLRPDMTGHRGNADIADLAAAGADFDRVFLARMIRHHASAVMMADEVRMAEPRGQVNRLAREIMSAQAKEIGQMQMWRRQWYPPNG